MKALIVYYSMSGNTEYAANELARMLGADTLRIEPKKAYPSSGARKILWGGKSAIMAEKPKLVPYTLHAEDYDTVIFGSPVWASNVAPPLRTFMAENGEALRGKRFAAFVCYLGGGGGKALEKLTKLLGVETLAAQAVLTEPLQNRQAAAEKLGAMCKALTE
ncbi:MAG: NAD(P)H-dependent oxidoreductase [Oscillospiraceae bacterium]|nr:NAD(P)H-dependent oxidoreductase [Oscillospiraceae bacterium]